MQLIAYDGPGQLYLALRFEGSIDRVSHQVDQELLKLVRVRLDGEIRPRVLR